MINFAAILPKITLGLETAETGADIATSLQILILLTVLSLVPSILILTTSFIRIVVVFSFLRRALATQRIPPNQVLIGLALFMTLFIMQPVWSDMYKDGVKPYLDKKIDTETAYKRSISPLRNFMAKQVNEKDLALFVHMAKMEKPKTMEDVPTRVLIPAFVISELKISFQIGFLIFIPFLVVDIVIASLLMSMGMMMLPPIMISLPFKLLIFVLVDGWHLLVFSLLKTFQ